MVETGENLHHSFFTFKYPGREPLLLDQFISSRPDILSYYIYDVMLSSGRLLYSCKGGIGVTKERYISDMHQCINNISFYKAIYSTYQEYFGELVSKRKYLQLRNEFNSTAPVSLSTALGAKLYLLWCLSGYAHKYRGRGYDAIYLPHEPKYELIRSSSIVSRSKNLIFRKEDLYTFSESLLHDQVVVYLHLPSTFGRYGCGFLWNEGRLKQTISMIEELDSLGYKVCISTTLSKYKLTYQPTNLFPKFDLLTVEGFKGSRLLQNSSVTEAYFLNF